MYKKLKYDELWYYFNKTDTVEEKDFLSKYLN